VPAIQIKSIAWDGPELSSTIQRPHGDQTDSDSDSDSDSDLGALKGLSGISDCTGEAKDLRTKSLRVACDAEA
jgi:hypothetical protein